MSSNDISLVYFYLKIIHTTPLLLTFASVLDQIGMIITLKITTESSIAEFVLNLHSLLENESCLTHTI